VLQAAPDRSVTLQSAIQRYFEVSLYLLVLTGFGTLASTGTLDLPTVALVSMVLFVRGFLLAKRIPAVIPERWTSYLTIVYVAFYLFDYFFLSRSFVTSTVHLVLFGMLVRLYSLQRERDHYTLAILAFLMVLSAAVLTVDSTFLLTFGCFLLLAIVTFMLMEIRHSISSPVVQSPTRTTWASYREMAMALSGVAPIILTMVLLGGVVVFFVLPRVSSRYLTSYATGSSLQTGFSDKVQLGSIGQIQQSNAVVMRVHIDGDDRGSHDLRWRGIALSVFDGRIWSNPFDQRVAARNSQGQFVLSFRKSAPGDQSKPIHYRVVMEPIASNLFFLASHAYLLEGPYRAISLDTGEAVFNLDNEHPITVYEADSDVAIPPLNLLRSLPPYAVSASAMPYLQLPPLDIRIPKLAEEVTSGGSTPYEKAAALEHYLQTAFGYTLQLPRTPTRDPLANFLFERKQGHCEYFASSMAVMLRTLNIPSRVVNGFRTSEFNDLTGNYIVRASSAHSWVEAYFSGAGWVTFDPTPAAAAAEHTSWNRMMLYMDAAGSFWREWVVNYDSTHQRTLGDRTAQNGRALFDSSQLWLKGRYERLLAIIRRTRNHIMQASRVWVGAGLLVIFTSLLLLKGRAVWRFAVAQRMRRKPESSPREAAALWYYHLTRRLGKRGWKKRPSQTARAFLIEIDDKVLREKVEQFTSAYERARFGESTEDAGQLPSLYQEVDQVLKGQPGTGH
jgi:protein-glutamine gamma-glutamyltransferase